METSTSETILPGSVLVDSDIRKLVSTQSLIEGFDGASLEGASYDLRLGHQFIKHGAVERLTEDRPALSIKAGEFAILRSLEKLNMPLDLIGHNGIMSPWAKLGLVSLFSPQIDPGFKGFLIVPVFNAGDVPISITWKEKIFTVEFVRTTQKASVGWSEKHPEQDRMVIPVTPTHVRATLADIEPLQEKIKNICQRLETLELSDAKWSGRWDRTTMRRSKAALTVAILALIVTAIAAITRPDWKIPDFNDAYHKLLNTIIR